MEEEPFFIQKVPSIAINSIAWVRQNLTPELNHRMPGKNFFGIPKNFMDIKTDA